MSPDFVAAYVLDHAAGETVPVRIQLYRGLAQMGMGASRGPQAEKNSLLALAETLEIAEARHAELALHFSQPEGGR